MELARKAAGGWRKLVAPCVGANGMQFRRQLKGAGPDTGPGRPGEAAAAEDSEDRTEYEDVVGLDSGGNYGG